MPLLYDPQSNPDGMLLETALEVLIDEVRAKQDKARLKAADTGGRYLGARESATVVTKLEEALLWQLRRGQLTGAVQITATPAPALSECGERIREYAATTPADARAAGIPVVWS